MTEEVFLKENTEYRLVCKMLLDSFIDGKVSYSFSLTQRELGKRKWLPIAENKYKFSPYSHLNDVLKYLTKSEIMEVVIQDYKKYVPTEERVFKDL